MAKLLKRKKNPWIAAILNFFFWGTGYVYNGKRVWFGIGLFVSDVFMMWSAVIQTLQSGGVESIMWHGLVLITLLFAYDAYREAKELKN